MPQKKIIVFLGAGASKVFGYPLTAEILPGIINGINKNQLFKQDAQNKIRYSCLLKNLIISLSCGLESFFEESKVIDWGKNEIELPLVTDLLSQLDHLISIGQDVKDWNFEPEGSVLRPSSIYSRVDLKTLKILFEWAIISVIDSVRQAKMNNLPNFFSWIKKVNKSNKTFVTVITSNYDTAVEWNLLNKTTAWHVDKIINYGFSWREPILESGEIHSRPQKPEYRILKLHGSIDWLKCERCGYIYINPTLDMYTLAFQNFKNSDNTCHCGYWPLKPVLITPSYIHNSFDSNLQEIWKTSAEQLRKADEWIIVGYSLPNEDFNIKSLFLRSMHGRSKKPKIRVIQKSETSRKRYNNFFGENNYSFISGGLENFDFSAVN